MVRRRSYPLVIVVVGSLCALGARAQGFQQPQETLPGFKPNAVYETQGIEYLSLFNGDPQLAVPLGPEYPLGPRTAFHLTAHYSTRFWHMYEVECGSSDCGMNRYPRAHVRGLPTLGVGWTLELGSIDPSPAPNIEARYLSPDGGIHEFFEPAIGSSKVVNEAGVRIDKLPTGGYVVRRPDGTSLWLTHFYTVPSPANGWDFSDVDHNAGYPRAVRWGLSEIHDPFGTTVLSVTWQSDDPGHAWKIDHIHLTSSGQLIQFHWGAYQGSHSAPPATWDVLESIDFPILASPSLTVTATFERWPDGHFSRTEFEGGWETHCPELAPTIVDLPFLRSISQSTRTHSFEYDLGDAGHGNLTAYTLPTGGRVAFGYRSYTALPPCLTNHGCTSFDESPVSRPTPTGGDPVCGGEWARVQRYLDGSPAVVSRTESDPTTGLSATTTYDRDQFAEPLGSNPPDSHEADPARILRRVIVKRQSGNGAEVFATRHLFHVLIGFLGSAGPGVEVERRTYTGSLAAGAPVRSLVQCFDDVWGTPYATSCGATGSDGAITEFPLGIDQRLSREVTWYGANPIGGADCSPATATAVACKVVDRTGWNATAQEFTQETTRAPKQGPSSILMQGGQTARRTTVSWDPQSGPYHWQPKLYTSRTVEDLYEGACPFAPCSVTTTTSFDPVTGALNSSTVSGGGVSRTTALEYTNGDPVAETISGVGLSDTYRTDRTFLSGLVTTSRRALPADLGWLQFDVTRDAALGLVTRARDPNGLETRYSWDSLRRLKGIAPPDPESPTTICYGTWDGGTRGAWSLVRKGSSTSCSTTAAVPSVGSETAEAYVYDGFGRLSREIRLRPNTTAAGTYLAVRTTERNGIGLVTAVSEWVPCGSGTDLASCFSSSAANKTVSSSFDTFGRPRSIVLPDGTQITKRYDDWDGIFQGNILPSSETREDTWTSNVAGGRAYEAVRKDLFGRPIAAADPTVETNPPTLGPITFYYYDIHDEIAEVSQTRTAANGSPHEQVRLFSRNALGFLTSETHPESGVTTYGSFTALGSPQTRTSGGVTVTTAYDALGRVLAVSSGGQSLLEKVYDEASDANGNSRGWSLGRLTTSTRSNSFPSTNYDTGFFPGGKVTESNTYSGLGGRLSAKSTTLSNGSVSTVQSWTYNELGLVATEGYPRNPWTQGFSVATSYKAGLPTSLLASDGTTVASQVKYDPAGGLSAYTSGNWVTTTITPDPYGMTRPRMISTSNGLFSTGVITYDGAGNITSMGSDAFVYDAKSQLVRATYSSGTQAYEYDGWGNLTRKAGTSIGIDSATNRLSGATYDARGNVTLLGAETYSYDALGRQVRHDAPSSHWSYLLDAGDERVVKSIPPSTATPVARRDMARIVLQAMSETPRATCAGYFADVPCSDPERGWIERFYELGITSGCAANPRRFCPNNTLTRREMAVFLAVAMARPDSVPASGTVSGVGSYTCAPSGGTSLFTDVPASDWGCPFIHYIFKEGVTGGCAGPPNPRRYCPDSTTSHWEMEVFASTAWSGFRYVPPQAVYTFRGTGGSILTEYLDSAVSKDYVYLGGRLVGSRDSGGWKYHTTDHLGSVRLTMNSSGGAVESRKYWPWGEDVGLVGAGRIAFAGMETDLEATRPRYYDHARNIDTGFGRFLSPDILSGKVEDPQSWNRYTYARNNPLKYVDPDGKAIVPANGFGLELHQKSAAFTAAKENFANASGWRETAKAGWDVIKSAFSLSLHEASLLPGPAAIEVPAASAVSKLGLLKSLTSDALLTEVKAGLGEAIAGAGAKAPLRDVARLVAEHGGKAGDWAKIARSAKLADGTVVEIHAYKNVVTGVVVEPKSKLFWKATTDAVTK